MKNLAPSLLLFGLIAACNDNDGDRAASTTLVAEKLSVEELAVPPSIAPLDKERLQYVLAESVDLLKRGGKNSSVAGLICSEVTMDQPWSATKERLSLNVAIDLRSCVEREYAAQLTSKASFNVSRANLFGIFENGCKECDLSAFDGKKAGDIEAPKSIPEWTLFHNLKSEIDLTVTAEGQTVAVSSLSISSESTANNEPCVYTRADDLVELQDGCTYIEKNVGGGDFEAATYVKFVSSKVKYADSDTSSWYATGTFEATINDWTGTITFKGSDTNPTYVLKRGTETASGSISEDGIELTSVD